MGSEDPVGREGSQRAFTAFSRLWANVYLLCIDAYFLRILRIYEYFHILVYLCVSEVYFWRILYCISVSKVSDTK